MDENTQPSHSGSSNKMWYIIGAIVVALLLLWIVPRLIGGALLGAAGVNVDRDLSGATTYSDNNGNSASVGTSARMPENWPSDAPANYSGASIVYSGTSNPQTGKAGSAVSYTVKASAQSVADYYKQQLTSAGWAIQSTANMGGATVVTATKDTRTFGAYITDAGGGNVTVTAGIEL